MYHHTIGTRLEERDEIISILALLEPSKRHLGAWDILLGVLEIFELKASQPYRSV